MAQHQPQIERCNGPGLACARAGFDQARAPEREMQGLQRLAWAYALLPCALKLLAAALLYRLLIRPISLLPDPGVAP